MEDWFSYIDCGAKIFQILMCNSMVLSNNPLYNANEIIQSDEVLRPITIALVKQIAPSYEFDYIPGYGFSNKTLEEASKNFEKTIKDISNCFTFPDKSRKKYLFLLGKDLCAYKFVIPSDEFNLIKKYKEDIVNDLIGANIPAEFINVLEDDISILANRVVSYLDSLEDTIEAEDEIKDLILQLYSQNEDLQIRLLTMLDEIILQSNKRSKLEKIEQFSTLVSNTITIASPFLPQLQEALQRLL